MFKRSWNSWLIESNKMERLWLLAKIDRVDHLELFCRVHRRDYPDPAGQKIPLRIQQHEKMEIYVSSAIAWTSSENTVGERLL